MFEILRGLHRKIDEVIGRQERALSLLSAVQTGGKNILFYIILIIYIIRIIISGRTVMKFNPC